MSAVASATAEGAPAPQRRPTPHHAVAATLAAAALLLQPLAAAGSALAAPEYSLGGKELFSPMAYSGRWYEVASLKKGFAGEGQQDCHCTQGIYTPQSNEEGELKLSVSTFCVHRPPGATEGGRLSGIQGSVSCANPIFLELLPEFKSDQERADDILEKCVLTFDSLPFIPPEPYDVIRTDYKSYALVQGAKDRSFVQIYSRTPNPGAGFIAEQKAVLAGLGYPADEIADTPQDCPEMSPDDMMATMNKGMAKIEPMKAGTPMGEAMAGYDLGPVQRIAFDKVRNPFEALKDVFKLFGS